MKTLDNGKKTNNDIALSVKELTCIISSLQGRVSVVNAPAMMWIRQETGGTSTERPASVMREAAMPRMTDTRMTSVQVWHIFIFALYKNREESAYRFFIAICYY